MTVRASYFSLRNTGEQVAALVRDAVGENGERVVDDNDIIVDLIPHPDTISHPTYRCFRIRVPSTLSDTVLSPETWPEGVSVRRMFRRTQVGTHM